MDREEANDLRIPKHKTRLIEEAEGHYLQEEAKEKPKEREIKDEII